MAEIQALNAHLRISSEFADKLWAEGCDEAAGKPLPDFGRQSANGAWLVRRWPAPLYEQILAGMAPQTACDLAYQELQNLRTCGVSHITTGFTPVNDGKELITVQPWINDLEKCPQLLFRRTVAPKLACYFEKFVEPGYTPSETRTQSEPYFWDLDNKNQYSVRASAPDEPVLHDLEPRFSTSMNEAYFILQTLKPAGGYQYSHNRVRN